MVSMTIRNVPGEARDRLAARAAQAGQSLQEYLRSTLVELAERPTTDEWLAEVRAHVQRDGGTRISAEEIVQLVHEGRSER